MDQVKNGSVVTLECVGKLENNMVFTDSSEDGPLTFVVGEYETIKGLNQAVVGMTKGQSKSVLLGPEQAFGDYDEELLIEIPMSDLPENAKVGMQLKSDTDSETPTIWTIKEIKDEGQVAILDSNHILAGHKIKFEVKVINIEENRPTAATAI